MKFVTVRIHFLSDVFVLFSSKILLPWQRDVTAISPRSINPMHVLLALKVLYMYLLLHGRWYMLFPRLSWLLVFREYALKHAAWISLFMGIKSVHAHEPALDLHV